MRISDWSSDVCSSDLFESLKDSDDWRRWNETRGQSRPPGGERIIEVQSRIADHLDEMRRTMPEGTVVMVSNADVIRDAVCHVLGLSPDNCQRLEKMERGSGSEGMWKSV